MKSKQVLEKGMTLLTVFFNLKCLIDLYLFRRQNLYCAFVDYRKAFDSVNRVLLWQKMLRNGIDGKLLTVLQNLYQNAKCKRWFSLFRLFLHLTLVWGRAKTCPPSYFPFTLMIWLNLCHMLTVVWKMFVIYHIYCLTMMPLKCILNCICYYLQTTL